MVVVCVRLPLVPVIVTVAVPVVAVLPAVKVNVLLLVVLDGLNAAVTPPGRPEAERLTLPVKPFNGLTVTVLVPAMVTVAVPVAAVLLAVSVSVLVLVVLDGLNEAVTPAGNPDADKLTLPVNPSNGLTVMVLWPAEPWGTVKLPGEADNEKSGAGLS